MDLDKLQKLAERQIVEKSKIEGKIESLKEDLKEEGFDSIDDAIEFIEKESKNISKNQKLLDKKIKEFEEKYGKELQKVN
jgi:chaperonin cofactor prefoldin